MKKARINFEKFLNSIVFYDTNIPIYQNFDPKENKSSKKIKSNLINQIDNDFGIIFMPVSPLILEY